MLAFHRMPIAHSLLDAMLVDPLLHGGCVTPIARPRLAEVDGTYTISVNAPGVSAEDLHVGVEGDVVKIDGETRSPSGSAHAVHVATQVPRDADLDEATVEHVDGVVTLKMPKKPAAVPTRIEVNATALDGDEETPSDDADAKPSCYTLTLPAPGMPAHELEVLAKEGMLKVSGESTRTGARVLKCFRLPEDADGASASASCIDGLLTVTIPKKAAAEAKTLAINGAPRARDVEHEEVAAASFEMV